MRRKLYMHGGWEDLPTSHKVYGGIVCGVTVVVTVVAPVVAIVYYIVHYVRSII
jgi:hypothetical protein